MDQWLATIPPVLIILVVAGFVAIESVGVPLPGETVLIAATLVSLDGHISPWLVWGAAVVGAVVGDSIGYLIGHRFGVRLLTVGARRFPQRFGPERIHRAIAAMNRWGALAVIGGRFVAVLRILVGPLAGTLRMPYRRFLAANVVGAILWSGAVVLIVSMLGQAAIEIIHQFAWVALLLVLVAIVVVAIVVVYRTRRAPAVELAAVEGASGTGGPGTAGPGTAEAGTGALEIGDLFLDDGSLSPLAARAGMVDGQTGIANVPGLAGVSGLAGVAQAAGVVFRPVGRTIRRFPFTTGLFGVFLIVGIATGALWNPVHQQPWYQSIAYGVPSFLAGQWWTLVTGTFFSQIPLHYSLILVGLIVGVGWAERAFGSRRAFGIFAGGQIVAVVGSLFFLLAARSFDSPWADHLGTQYDVGPSGGMLACLAAAMITLRAPWRLRAQFALFAAVTVALIYIGSLADIEHFFGVVGVMVVAPFIQGFHRKRGRPSMREWRILAFAGLVILAVVEIIGTLLPSDDPGTSTSSGASTWVDVLIDVVIIALIANGIRQGFRLSWVIAVLLGLFNVIEFVGLAAYAIIAVDFPPALFEAMTNSSLWIALLVILWLGRGAYRVPWRRSRRVVRQTDAQKSPLEILTDDGGGTLSWMTMWKANSYFVTADGDSFVAYQRHSGVAIALGDPVGPPEKLQQTIAEFVAECERIGLAPCFFSVSDLTLTEAPDSWTHLQVAEDTIIDLPTLEMAGKRWQPIRSAINRATREKITFRMTTLADEPWSIVSQVRAISEEWVGDKALPEMGFTLGGVDEALDPHVKTALALDENDAVQGVLSWLPVYGDSVEPGEQVIKGWTLDLMRRKDDGFKPVMEFLIASSCLHFQQEGALFVSLSGAPLAHADDAGEPSGIDAVLDSLGKILEPLYGFQSLHNFKTKFNPRYERMSLLYRDEADLPKIALGLTRAFLPNESLLGIARMGLQR
ncbi:phosphatidylglycerol lysyltransferase domain-containing protein [Subtercola sp. YIM 133946]|uniref:phosphatidylglycerol lysyltransferase domain-containing protein n=1 Tax=Subtercola sp. YIM 133946 TaxID=3118909 RepID=UPI002F92D073